MEKKEIAERLLNLIAFNDMLNGEIKKQNDGAPTFSDDPEYKESKAILTRAAIGILKKEEK